jgi:P27 family predicted phage terminase small subunit
MGKRGPVKQPTAIIKAKGYFQPSRHTDELAENNKLRFVYNELPEPPNKLKKFGKDKWTAVLSEMSRVNGYVSWLDLGLLEEYCYVCQEMNELKELARDRTYLDRSGNVKINPLYQELNKLRKDYIRLAQEFGLSPSARTRVTLNQDPIIQKEDEFEL